MKLDLGFGLDHAGWSAFLVDASGIVRQANQVAVQTFGTVMEGQPALSASIWTLENDIAPEEFLAKSERSSVPMTRLSFRVKGGATVPFQSYVCSQGRNGPPQSRRTSPRSAVRRRTCARRPRAI